MMSNSSSEFRQCILTSSWFVFWPMSHLYGYWNPVCALSFFCAFCMHNLRSIKGSLLKGRTCKSVFYWCIPFVRIWIVEFYWDFPCSNKICLDLRFCLIWGERGWILKTQPSLFWAWCIWYHCVYTLAILDLARSYYHQSKLVFWINGETLIFKQMVKHPNEKSLELVACMHLSLTYEIQYDCSAI